MSFIDDAVASIKRAKDDDEMIKRVLCEVYFSTQYDSSIRAEFDALFSE